MQSKKNKESAQSDLKAFGTHDEVFAIRLSRRYSAQMYFFISQTEIKEAREQIRLERRKER